MVTETFCMPGLWNLLVSCVYDFSSSNRTRMPFNDLQGVLVPVPHCI